MKARSNTTAGAVIVGLVAAALLSGCASRTDTVGGRASSAAPRTVGASTAPTRVRFKTPRAGSSTATHAAVRAVPQCRTHGSAFELSPVAGFRGAGNPVGAARWFVRHGGVAGYGHPSSVWVLADPAQVGRGEATLVNGSVSLHAVRMPNRTCAIDSGRAAGNGGGGLPRAGCGHGGTTPTSCPADQRGVIRPWVEDFSPPGRPRLLRTRGRGFSGLDVGAV